MLVPANQPPREPNRMLPLGAAIQVAGEEKHLDALLRWLRPEGECWVYATLHEATEELARSSRPAVEIRIDGARIGQLSTKMGGDLLAAIRHLDRGGSSTGARAIVKGNRIKVEVVLYAARAHDLPDSWLGVPAVASPQPHRSAPVAAPSAPIPVVPTAPVVPVVVPAPATEPGATPAPSAGVESGVAPAHLAGFRLNAPPN